MNNKIRYNNENYIILKNIIISKTEFAILINETYDRIIYLKTNYIGERATYVSFKSLIKVLPDYQNIASDNKMKILDRFMKVLNISINNSKFMSFEILMDSIDNFSEYMHKNEIYYYTEKKINVEIPENILKRLEKHLINYNKTIMDINFESKGFAKIFKKVGLVFDKILYNKFCGAYAIMVIVSAVGMMICYGEYADWKKSSVETKEVINDILSDVVIDYGEEISDEQLQEILENQETQAQPEPQPGQEYDPNYQFGADYWLYTQIPMMSVDFSTLMAKNEDTVGWLYVNNTYVNYPVVQTGDNEYYLDHSYDHSYNVAGWIFADYRADLTNFKRNNVIYGHGRGADNVMFGSLTNILEDWWYTNEVNHYVKLSTPTKNTVWKVFSVYTIQAEGYYLTHNFQSDDAFRAYLNTIVGRSIYNFNTDVNVNDKVLTLSTCLDNYGNRIVLHAKLVREEAR